MGSIEHAGLIAGRVSDQPPRSDSIQLSHTLSLALQLLSAGMRILVAGVAGSVDSYPRHELSHLSSDVPESCLADGAKRLRCRRSSRPAGRPASRPRSLASMASDSGMVQYIGPASSYSG